MNEKILITGGAGFIGAHLARRLLEEGYQVDLVDNFSRGVYDDMLKNITSSNKLNFKEIDLLDKKQIGKIDLDYDIIFHLAAIVGVKHVLDKPYLVLKDNVDLLSNVIELAKNQKKLPRLLFSSTSEVYSGALMHYSLPFPTPEDVPLTVTDVSHPRASYMLSKIYGEAMCHQSGLPFTIFRPHNIYGPRMGMSHVIPEQLQKAHVAKKGQSIPVNSLSHTRSFCYVDDAVEILFRIMNSKLCIGKVLNLGSQKEEVTIEKLVELCFSVVGKELKIKPLDPSPGSPVRRNPNMKFTRELINYESQISLKEGISLTYEWYREHIFDFEKKSGV